MSSRKDANPSRQQKSPAPKKPANDVVQLAQDLSAKLRALPNYGSADTHEVETSAPVVTFGPPPAKPAPEQVVGTLTRCRKCGSTRRTKYTNHREIAHGGVHGGEAHTHIVWRNTSCSDCGQCRVDQHFENRPTGTPNVA